MERIHHVQIWVRKNGKEFVKDFCTKFGFYCAAERQTRFCVQQWLIGSNNFELQFLITYPVTQKEQKDEEELVAEEEVTPESKEFSKNSITDDNDPYITWHHWRQQPHEFWQCSSENVFLESDKNPSSVYNVCFVVKNIQQQVNHLYQCGVDFVRPLATMSDDNGGSVHLATVRSCVGNVLHTLIDLNNYHGKFLPGFRATTTTTTGKTKEENQKLESDEKEKKNTSTFTANGVGGDKNEVSSSFLATSIDHVTFAVENGTSAKVLEWYEKCFYMKRFEISSKEDKNEGLVIQTPNVGMRLKAMKYWKCAEIGLQCNNYNENNNGETSSKTVFVIAESLPGLAPNQIDTFLKGHDGPGIQHIGLLTNNIIHTVGRLKERGVVFVEPPWTYYDEIESLLKWNQLDDYLPSLRKLGILIDVKNKEKEDENEPARYLMQKFTKPLFEEDTFFLEVIQRNGTSGFGEDNIILLWKSLQKIFDEKT